jgi:hypothetical protein
MPHPWLNLHKSTAAINYFFSNMTNTVIVMTLGDLRNRHTTAVPFSPFTYDDEIKFAFMVNFIFLI